MVSSFFPRQLLRLSLVAALAFSPPCHAQSADDITFDIATTPIFSDYQLILAGYLQKQKRKGHHDFCVVGYIHTDNTKTAWVIWKQAGKLILWEPGVATPGVATPDVAALTQSRRVLDLKHDVVNTDDDVHGSTYLVTKAWVKQIHDDCSRAGVKVSLPGKQTKPQH